MAAHVFLTVQGKVKLACRLSYSDSRRQQLSEYLNGECFGLVEVTVWLTIFNLAPSIFRSKFAELPAGSPTNRILADLAGKRSQM